VAGVHWDNSKTRWRAQINVPAGDGKRKTRHLGTFENELDAALAYDQAAREHRCDKAKVNFPDLPPQPQAASSHEPCPTPQPSLKHIPRRPKVASNRTSRKTTSQYRGEGRCTNQTLGCSP
jgi:hypothetical protein